MANTSSEGESPKEKQYKRPIWLEGIRIPSEALCEWKEQCSADKCSDEHRKELINSAFYAWKRYTDESAIWREERDGRYVFFSSDLKDVFGRQEDKLEERRKREKRKKDKREQKHEEYIYYHPFQIIEEVLYHKKRKNGEPFKNWMIAESANQKKPVGWISTVLFGQCLFRDYIRKHGGFNTDVCPFDDAIKTYDDHPSIPAQDKTSDLEYLRRRIRERLDHATESQIASVYYLFQSCAEPSYELSVEDICKITGVKKVFYDYKESIFKDVRSLREEDFDPVKEIIPALRNEIYRRAGESKICRALDARVAEKKRKKANSGPENSEIANF